MPEGQCEYNPLYNGSKGKSPPDTAKSHFRMGEDKSQRNSRTGQQDADDTA